MREQFEMVEGQQMPPTIFVKKERWYREKPLFATAFLVLILFGCFACDLIMTKDPTYLDLKNFDVAPNCEFLFGTDTMGRDIFSMIWYGGRISLMIGIGATVISTLAGILFGAVSGSLPEWADALLMRLTEILLSVPSLLIVVLVQAILGKANVWSISFVIGITSWMSIAKVVRTEVRQLNSREYVIASRCMGGGFFHVLWKHLTPNFISSIMFMVIMNIRNAIVAESTLSFMGLGLSVEEISWGSMLSLAENALLTNSWWMILIPGLFLLATLLCFTSLGNHLRRNANRKESNL